MLARCSPETLKVVPKSAEVNAVFDIGGCNHQDVFGTLKKQDYATFTPSPLSTLTVDERPASPIAIKNGSSLLFRCRQTRKGKCRPEVRPKVKNSDVIADFGVGRRTILPGKGKCREG